MPRGALVISAFECCCWLDHGTTVTPPNCSVTLLLNPCFSREFQLLPLSPFIRDYIYHGPNPEAPNSLTVGRSPRVHMAEQEILFLSIICHLPPSISGIQKDVPLFLLKIATRNDVRLNWNVGKLAGRQMGISPTRAITERHPRKSPRRRLLPPGRRLLGRRHGEDGP